VFISIIIIKSVINLILILLFLFTLGLCFKIENLFGAQFGELEKNVYRVFLKKRPLII